MDLNEEWNFFFHWCCLVMLKVVVVDEVSRIRFPLGVDICIFTNISFPLVSVLVDLADVSRREYSVPVVTINI